MPKKETHPQDATSLRNYAQRLEHTILALRAAADALEQYDYESVEVTHFLIMQKSMRSIENFGHAAREAFLELRHRDGAFIANGADPSGR